MGKITDPKKLEEIRISELKPTAGLVTSGQLKWLKENLSNNDIEEVRKSQIIYMILSNLGLDVANANIVIEGQGWQQIAAQKWLDSDGKNFIQEIVSKAWCYGRCYADPDIYFDGVYSYPKRIIPLHMPMVKIVNDVIKYGHVEITPDRYFTIDFFNEAGQPFPMATLLWRYVAQLDKINDFYTRGLLGGSQGIWLWKYTGTGQPQTDYNQIKEFGQTILKDSFFSTPLPVGWDVEVKYPQVNKDAFNDQILQLTLKIFQMMRSQYLMAATLQNGSYNAWQIPAKFYDFYKDAMVELILIALNEIWSKVAKWNLDTYQIKFVHNKELTGDVTSGYALSQAVTNFLNILPNVDEEFAKACFDSLGLPVPKTVLIPATPQVNYQNASNDAIETLFKAKHDGVWYSFRTALKKSCEGQLWQPVKFKFIEDLERYINIDETTKMSFEAEIGSHEDELNNYIKNHRNQKYEEIKALVYFDSVWNDLKSDVLRYGGSNA